jgi:hypothetical protein
VVVAALAVLQMALEVVVAVALGFIAKDQGETLEWLILAAVEAVVLVFLVVAETVDQEL